MKFYFLNNIFNMHHFFLFQTELSQTLQSLSDRARSATENMSRLKQLNDKVQVLDPSHGHFLFISAIGHFRLSPFLIESSPSTFSFSVYIHIQNDFGSLISRTPSGPFIFHYPPSSPVDRKDSTGP